MQYSTKLYYFEEKQIFPLKVNMMQNYVGSRNPL